MKKINAIPVFGIQTELLEFLEEIKIIWIRKGQIGHKKTPGIFRAFTIEYY